MPRGKRNATQAPKTPRAPRKPATGKRKPAHLLVVDRLMALITKIDKISKRVVNWQVAGLNEYLRESALKLSAATGSLDSLPEDFHPTARAGNGVAVGDVVLVKQKNVPLYEAIIGHPDTRLTVTAVQGAYLMCQTQNDAKVNVSIPKRHTEPAPQDTSATT